MENKLDEAKSLIKGLNKTFGENSIMIIGSDDTPKVDTITTGVLSFDLSLGGGMPKGRIIELLGMESSGKTSLALMEIAEAQGRGELCAFLDVEQALDFEYAKLLGVNIDTLVVSQPDNAEQALEIMDRLIESGLFGVIVLDSVAALAPKKELEGEMGEQTIGVMARLMSQAMRKLTAKIKKKNTIAIFINQLRDTIGAYIPMKTTTGGNALKFYASQRVEVSKGTQIKEGDKVIGYLMKIKVIKNKIYPPFKTASVDMIFGQGIDKIKDLLSVAVEKGIIQRSGSWYSYDGVKLGQGIDKVKELALDNPEMLDQIRDKVYELVLKK